ncbi:SO2930 family diheme c-type cytochrome [Microbulbifer sp. SAOS-129_SWC]|uniref:SO2930 family diheme c-type cytochrome n=1 Tax=Microbulbifer sp. SAOS-129_SWC TaxID=3145235 RepID=UPI003217817C
MRKLVWGAVLAPILALTLQGCDAPREQVTFFERDAVPEKLSAWHLVEAIDGELSPNAGVTPYDLNTALFSDYAHKLRTVWMPAGKSAKYAKEDFDYPVGTVLTKTFYYPKGKNGTILRTDDYSNDYVPGAAGERLQLANVRLMETRILVKRADGWQALPYVWNKEQTEATLQIAGDASRMKMVSESGDSDDFTYVVPDRNQCAGCHADNHSKKALHPLGPRARHLNKDYTYGTGTQNQLLHWQQIGYLTGLPEFAEIPRDADYADISASLDERARAYLDINCGHCHNPSGPAGYSGLDLYHEETVARRYGVCKPPIAAGTGSGDHLFDIVPGQPGQSIIPFRVGSTNPGAMMPELGRTLVHEKGLALLRDWIASMPGSCS